MVAVKEITWEEACAPDFEHTTRQAFRAAVDQVATTGQSHLAGVQRPRRESGGDRLARRCRVARRRACPGGQPVPGHARCTTWSTAPATVPTSPRAPSSWCKHRIAAGIQRRAMQAVQGAPTSSTAPAQPAAAATHPLPEAPASANCHVTIAGRQVQVTLRDTDETRLLERLTALLAQYPVEQAAASQSATTEGWCQVHQVQMRRNEKDGRSWWSPPAQDGNGVVPERQGSPKEAQGPLKTTMHSPYHYADPHTTAVPVRQTLTPRIRDCLIVDSLRRADIENVTFDNTQTARRNAMERSWLSRVFVGGTLGVAMLLSSAVLAQAQTCTTRYNPILKQYQTQSMGGTRATNATMTSSTAQRRPSSILGAHAIGVPKRTTLS